LGDNAITRAACIQALATQLPSNAQTQALREKEMRDADPGRRAAKMARMEKCCNQVKKDAAKFVGVLK